MHNDLKDVKSGLSSGSSSKEENNNIRRCGANHYKWVESYSLMCAGEHCGFLKGTMRAMNMLAPIALGGSVAAMAIIETNYAKSKHLACLENDFLFTSVRFRRKCRFVCLCMEKIIFGISLCVWRNCYFVFVWRNL